MNNEIEIRLATIDDCVPLSRVFEDVVRPIPYYNDVSKESEIDKFRPSNLENNLKEDPYSVIVATINDEIVGFCFSRFDDYLIWLEWFGVVESQRGKGITNLLLAELEQGILTRKCHKIWCDCRTSNVASIHILGNYGFKQIVTIPDHWFKQDFIIWEKPIN
ncbi:MAG: GNAT family N-acetyltransferase [Ginsengibacter sp.]